MSLLDDLKKFAAGGAQFGRGVYHQANPWDQNRTFDTNARGVMPGVQRRIAVTPAPGQDTRNLFSRLWDQANPVDAGRTFKSDLATKTGGSVNQLLHSGTSNTVGNFVKPFSNMVTSTVVEPARSLTAQITHNRPAEIASDVREKQALQGSAPFLIGKNIFQIGKANLVDLPKEVAGDLTGNKVASANANTAYLRDINQSAVGQLLNIPQRQLAGYQVRRDLPQLPKPQQAQATEQSVANVGLNPKENLFQQGVETAAAAAQLAAPTWGFTRAVVRSGVPQEVAGAAGTAATSLKPSTAIENHPAVTQLNNHIDLINRLRDRYSAQGLAEGSPQMVNNRRALASAVAERDRVRQQVGQGGYVRVSDGKNITPPRRSTTDIYGMQHRPDPQGALGHDLESMAPDIYSRPDYYHTGAAEADAQSVAAIQAMRANPEAKVTIYRAGPKNEINVGDWVTPSKAYALQEAATEKTPVHAFQVKASELRWPGDSINEFGFYPEKTTRRTALGEGGYVGKGGSMDNLRRIQDEARAFREGEAAKPKATPEQVQQAGQQLQEQLFGKQAAPAQPAAITPELQPIADNIIKRGASKQEFVTAFNKALKDQNLAKRKAAQNTATIINKQHGSPEAFYDAVTGGSGRTAEASIPGAPTPTEAGSPALRPIAKGDTTGVQPVGQVLRQDRFQSYPEGTTTPIKVKGPMSPADYMKRYGKEGPPGKNVKVKPFTMDSWDFSKWQDKSALGLNRETLDRNLPRVAGKDAEAARKFLVETSRNNETARANFLNKVRGEVKSTVVDRLGIRAGSEDSALVQKFGEKQPGIDYTFLVKSVGKDRADRIVEASNYLRSEYDRLLEEWNVVRRKYGYAPVPKREDYFRHFQEISNTINQVGMILKKEELPTAISGKTDIFKPGKPFSTAELRRMGGKTTEDAVAGFDNYLDAVSRQIFHLDTVQRGRALENAIRKASETNQEIQLPNFVANLGEWVNSVSGKKTRIDRAAEALIGRKVYGAMNTLRGQTGANMIGANLSSAMAQFIPWTQHLSATAKPALIRGLADTLSAPLRKGRLTSIDGVQSGFLTRRFKTEHIDLKGVKHGSEIVSKPFRMVDEFTSRSVVAGKYYEALAKLKDKNAAMKVADDYAAKLMTDRTIGQTPLLFDVKTSGALTQFQTEINNQISFLLRDIPAFKGGNPAAVASALTQFFVYSYLFNSAYEQINGQRPQIDPIAAVLNLAGKGESGDATGSARVNNAWQNIATGLPFVSIFTGGRLPVNAMLPDIKSLYAGGKNALTGEGPVASELWQGVKGPVFYGLPPFGGGQLKKTAEGAWSLAKGYSETPAGRVRFDTSNMSPADKLKTLLFGQYASTPGRKYVNAGPKPLGDTQSELFKALPSDQRGGFMERVKAERQANATLNALKKGGGNILENIFGGGSAESGKTTGSTTKGGNTIIQLKTGKFTTNIGGDYKSFDTKKEAQDALDLYKFKQSGDKKKIIGETVYYKTGEGDVRHMSKIEYDFNQADASLNLKLDRLYEANNLQGWLDTAQQKYGALEAKKQLYDPTTEADKINSITLQQENLMQKAQKYIDKGYLKSGAGRGGRKDVFTPPASSIIKPTSTYSALRSLLGKTKSSKIKSKL